MQNFFKNIAYRLAEIYYKLGHLFTFFRVTDILIEDYIDKNLHRNEKYSDPRKLTKFEYQIHSQNGEDGIINEIFKRIGTTNKNFIEFGVGDGLENNTAALLLEDWKGFWIDGSERFVKMIHRHYASALSAGHLQVKQAMITSENIEQLFHEMKIPDELDLLSIDIDGNDYWIWKAIQHFSPRVVVIEYNALYRENIEWIMKYNPAHSWDGSCYHGASLKSLEKLGQQKGYQLVGCNFTGCNAFFVRDDLIEDHFFSPFTSENHFEPFRGFLYRRNGHRRGSGPFER